MPFFTIRILDRNRTLLAILDRVTTWSYTRKPSEAGEISVSVPYEIVQDRLSIDHPLYAFLAPSQPVIYAENTSQVHDPLKLEHAQLANFIQVWEGAILRVSGRITGRDVGTTSVSIKAMSEEILLERNLCPAQYGRVFDNWDLADLARFLLKGWHVERVKSQSQWSMAIESSNIDITTEPGLVMLAKDINGKYYPSGFITMRFNRTVIPDFAGWDRIRWSADNQEPVTTSMQYRYGADAGSMGAWSQEFPGAQPDEIGVVPGTVDANIIDVRINLRTSDTSQEDPNGKPVGQTPVLFALEVVARTPAVLQAGSIPGAAGVTVKDIDADNDNALSILVNACEQAGWEFEVVNGRLNLAEKIGADRRSAFVFRDGTNTRIQRLKDDDSELVNVLIAQGPGDGLNRMQLVLRDQPSIDVYDVRPKRVEFDEKDETKFRTKAQAYLDEHKNPIQGFDIDDLYPANARPEYGIGDLVRVVDPRSGTVVESRILEHTRSYSSSGLKVTNRLGKPRASLIERSLRIRESLELPVPHISVSSTLKGVVVRVPAPPSLIRWASTEVHLSTEAGFTPTPSNLQDNGRRTRFDIVGIPPGVRYFCRARYVSTDGTTSLYSAEYSAVAGSVMSQDLSQEIIDDIQQALSTAANAQSTADGKITTYYQADQPSEGSEGDLWFDANNKLHRHNGTSWVDAQDTAIGDAIDAAAGAQSTADGKVTTFYSSEVPTAEGVGDLWIHTSDDNHPYRWSGSEWVSIRDQVPIDPSRLDRFTDDGRTGISGNAIVTRDGSNVDRIILGNVSGQPYAGNYLPANTFGLWGREAGIFLQGYTKVIAAGQVTMPGGLNADGSYGVVIPLGGSYPRDHIVVQVGQVNGGMIPVMTYEDKLVLVQDGYGVDYYEVVGAVVGKGYSRFAKAPPIINLWTIHAAEANYVGFRPNTSTISEVLISSVMMLLTGDNLDAVRTFYSLGAYGIPDASYVVLLKG